MSVTKSGVRRRIAAVVVAVHLVAIGRVAAEPDKTTRAWPANGRPPHGDIAGRMRDARTKFASGPVKVRAVADADPRAADIAARLKAGVDAIRGRAKAGGATVGPTAPRPRAPGLEKRAVVGGETVDVRRAPGSATPRQLRFSGGPKAAVAGATRVDRDTATARALLRRHRNLLKLRDPDAEMRVLAADVDDCGCCQVRFQQTYRGLDVWPSQLIVQVRDEGDADLVSGAYVSTPRRIVVKPTIDAAAALRAARAGVPGSGAAETTAPELIVHAGVMGPHGIQSPPRLAWKLELRVADDDRRLVCVDAHTARVIENVNEVCFEGVVGSGVDLDGVTRSLHVWHKGSQFFLCDTSKPMFDATSDPPTFAGVRGGIVVTDNRNRAPLQADGHPPADYEKFDVASSNPNAWADRDAVSAAFCLSETYDYFLQRHGRDSIDGAGGTMLAVVHVASGYLNASWDGQKMAFGDAVAFAGALDVVGHELAHGVTGATARLRGGFQSGALNEAMSDVFGQMVETRTDGTNDWLMFDAIPAQFSRFKRDLRDPNSGLLPNIDRPCPAKMSQFIVEDVDHDGGGVHDNSTIISHAFYLLAEGLPNAVGAADAERIFYRTDTTKLTPSSQFIDCRFGAVSAATELFGAGSNQVAATRAAFDAVEIFETSPTPPPPDAEPIDAADSALFVRTNAAGTTIGVGRRETQLGDGVGGVSLIDSGAGVSRPSISGDGSLAAFVSGDNDVVLMATDGATPPEPQGVAGLVHSLAMSPDGTKFAFVLLTDQGEVDNSIRVVDLANPANNRSFPLTAPVDDAGSVEVALADTMSFSRDGDLLVYDGFNVLSFPDGSEVGAWSLYALDLASEATFAVFPPIDGYDIGNPSFSRTSDRYVVFEAVDSFNGESTILTLDRFANSVSEVFTLGVTGVLAVPCYTGDDRAVVFTAEDQTNTGFSLAAIALEADHQTPTGDPALFVSNAAFGVVYRRGAVPELPPPESFELVVETGAAKIDSLACAFPVIGGTANVSLALAHGVSGGFTNGGPCTIGTVDVAVSGKLTFNAKTRQSKYSLTLRSASPKTLTTISGVVGAGTARVVFKGPPDVGVSKNGALPVQLDGYFPTSRVTLRPQIDFRGRITGTGTILGGFGNDQATVGALSGKVTAKSLTLTLNDKQLGRKIAFSGKRIGNEFVGTLTHKIRPAAGAIKGFVVPDLFGF